MTDKPEFFQNVSDPARFRTAIQRFDAVNSADPNREMADGEEHPRELLYARRLCAWVLTLDPQAGENLRLAARSQHLGRWNIPRSSFPQNRAGYHQWKSTLKRYHAEESGIILLEVGYGPEVVVAVSALNLKKNFPADPECRVLEDALCLMFLQHQFADLVTKAEEEIIINALQKSWAKMTDSGRQHALRLPYTAEQRRLVDRALGG